MIRSFQELMPYGLDVPVHTDCIKYSRFSNRLWSGCPGRLCRWRHPDLAAPPTVRSSSGLSGKQDNRTWLVFYLASLVLFR